MPNRKPNSQSSPWVRKGLGTQAPQIIWDYNFVPVIAIRLLTQPLTCGIGFSFSWPCVYLQQQNNQIVQKMTKKSSILLNIKYIHLP